MAAADRRRAPLGADRGRRADAARRRAAGAARRQVLDAGGDRRSARSRPAPSPDGAAAPSGPAAGVFYAAAIVAAPTLLRREPRLRLRRRFCGCSRSSGAPTPSPSSAGALIGGPRLWPRVSPGKTWSGAIVGTFAGAAAGAVVGFLAMPGGVAPRAAVLARRRRCDRRPDRRPRRVGDEAAFRRQGFEPPDPRPRRRSWTDSTRSSRRRFSPRWSAGRAATASWIAAGLFQW